MIYKVLQVIQKYAPTQDRPYPVCVALMEDENKNTKVVKVFFEVKEGDVLNLDVREKEYQGIKELVGSKIKEREGSGGGVRVAFANSEEGQKLIAKISIFKSVCDLLSESQNIDKSLENIEKYYKLGVKLILGEDDTREEKKEN